MQLDLEKNPFALAYEMVEKGQIDPWDIDISELAQAYLSFLKEAELKDLRIPARVIYAAAFLLKKQAQSILPDPPRKRQRITLREIEEQFYQQEQSLAEEKTDKKASRKRSSKGFKKPAQDEPNLPLHISRYEDALREILLSLDASGVIFSLFELVKDRPVVPHLLALMNLYSEGAVDILQQAPYKDLSIVKLKPTKGSIMS
ncbi:MAG: segregation/condensation protein A [Aquificaceae bacterium]